MTLSMKKCGRAAAAAIVLLIALAAPAVALAQQPEPAVPEVQAEAEPRAGGEANLVLPDLSLVDVGGYDSRTLLLNDEPARRAVRLALTEARGGYTIPAYKTD